jgi:hypothetical protein
MREVPMFARRLPTLADLRISKSQSSQCARLLPRAADCCRTNLVSANRPVASSRTFVAARAESQG